MTRRIDLTEAERTRQDTEREAFTEALRWLAQIATPILLALILWRIW